jgi:hypothetical protein
VTGSEADRLRFVAADEHALAIGRANPPRLFIHLIRGRLWRYLTQGDEDRPNGRIRAFARGPEPPRAAGLEVGRTRGRSPSADAVVVREVRAEMIRRGIFRDPFGEFARLNPGWTRERWDPAMAELERPRRRGPVGRGLSRPRSPGWLTSGSGRSR